MQPSRAHLFRRREFLRAGSLALGGLSLPQLLKARAAGKSPVPDTAVILLYLHGGPSQLETYDLKPDAPSEYRSVFRPIATTVPGVEICEWLPQHARVADKFTVLRSLHHTMSSHSDGGIEVLTGKTPVRPDPTSTSKSDHPDFGSVASRVRGGHPAGLPQYAAIPQPMYMVRPNYLGLHHGAFAVGDPSSTGFAPRNLTLSSGLDGPRIFDRRRLLQQFDRLRSGADLQGSLHGMDQFGQAALEMLTSTRTARAFDLKQEPETLRDRYGRHVWGQGCLLARRLAEAGVAVITLYINTPQQGEQFTNWDDHIMNAGRPGHFGKFMEVRLPYFDQALAALIEDIYARGLDRQILVVATGEFGRTPRLSQNANGVGRDHWPDAYSVLVSGGGLRMGQVIGATNSKAEFPTQRPLTPQDLLATVYRHLGVAADQSFLDHAGRPIRILDSGTPIAELL